MFTVEIGCVIEKIRVDWGSESLWASVETILAKQGCHMITDQELFVQSC
jgi:hypothetical protein